MNEVSEALVILDYGSQYTQLIARRARELNVFSVIVPFNSSLADIEKYHPKGIILSGGPSSVYQKNAPQLSESILHSGLPILGICYGMQLLVKMLGGEVAAAKQREYGLAKLDKTSDSQLLPNNINNSAVWMSHGDHAAKLPDGFELVATSQSIICAIENSKQKTYGLQFHPEVSHTKYGAELLKNFIITICKFKGSWTSESFTRQKIKEIKKLVGSNNVICALSGGVDSSVAASLVHQAIGSQQICLFVDTGLLRKGEYEEVLEIYKNRGLNVKPIKAADRFLAKLSDVEDPEKKRKIIGAEFIAIFEAEARKIKNADFLVQGTLYPDVIESISVNGPSVTIKSHHNVGGLPEHMQLKLVEPLRELFKDEVRLVGKKLGLPENMTQRQPFPGPGLAVRIIGRVTKANVSLLQLADAIVREEVIAAKMHKKLWQYFAVLLPIESVGVMGDGRTYERVVALRTVTSSDGMTADWAKLPHELLGKISSRIISEVKGVNRVVYDITSKPPGTIEWE